jgi:hypothetical protein
MPRKIVTALFFAFALTTGCSQAMNEVNAGSVKVKLNPHSQQRYELTFTVHDAPGSFDSVTGEITYEVWNEGCVPTDSISGAHSKTPGFSMSFPLTKLSDNVYRGEVDLDLPVNEDYFGLGVCQWKANSAGIDLKSRDVNFVASIMKDEIFSRKKVNNFLWKGDYFKPPTKNYVSQSVPESVYASSPVDYQSNYFDISIDVKEM